MNMKDYFCTIWWYYISVDKRHRVDNYIVLENNLLSLNLFHQVLQNLPHKHSAMYFKKSHTLIAVINLNATLTKWEFDIVGKDIILFDKKDEEKLIAELNKALQIIY